MQPNPTDVDHALAACLRIFAARGRAIREARERDPEAYLLADAYSMILGWPEKDDTQTNIGIEAPNSETRPKKEEE